jgi:hypothetical protein
LGTQRDGRQDLIIVLTVGPAISQMPALDYCRGALT